jgi:ribosomal protein S18 acetylase RimI-like enzyme
MSEPRLEADAWLTQQLGKPSFHLAGDIGRLCPQASPIMDTLNARALFADVKIAVADVVSVAAVQRLGFTLIDTSLRFILPRPDAPKRNAPDIMFATPDMAEAVGEIAARSFVHDRFHRDPAIVDSVADGLKRSWATNFFSGKRGDWMVVACTRDRPAGFLQLLRLPDGALVIDLIAVATAERGRGVAPAMIAFACKNCECAGPILVATQVGNTPSVRLYEKIGFRLDAAHYVFHHHGAAC